MDKSFVLSPWPPSSPSDPLPRDQRGCGFPWGRQHYKPKLQLRYDAIGLSSVGPINPIWAGWATGQLLLCRENQTFFHELYLDGEDHSATTGSVDQVTITEGPNDVWHCNILSNISTPMIIYLFGQLILPTAFPTGPFEVPVTAFSGPANAPEAIRVTPVLWYETAQYAYLGP